MAGVAALAVSTASVKNGKLVLHNRRAFDAQVRVIDGRWALEVTVARLLATRSIQANRYYFGVVVQALSEHTGYTPDEIHELLKQRFLPKRLAICDGNGEIKGEYVMGGTTRTLTAAEFSEYVEGVKRWAATELDVYIPDANEVLV